MQPQQQEQVVSSENTTHLPPQPPIPPKNITSILFLYGPNYRISHQLPPFHQMIQDYDIR